MAGSLSTAANSALPLTHRPSRADDAEFSEADHPRGEGGKFSSVAFEATPGRIGTKEYQSKSFPSMEKAIEHAKEQGWHIGGERTPEEHPDAIKHQFGHSGGGNVKRFHYLSHQGHSPGALVEREHEHQASEPITQAKSPDPKTHEPEKAIENAVPKSEENPKEKPSKNPDETWTAYRKRVKRLGFDEATIFQPNPTVIENLCRKPVGDEDIASAKGHAAGTLYVAPDGAVLLLRRSPTEKNFAGHWSLPGGGVEDGESPEDGARREAMEEMGPDIPQGRRKLIDQKVTPTGMVFHTFAQPVDEKFTPKLNDEHDGFLWVSLIDLLKYLSEEPDAK